MKKTGLLSNCLFIVQTAVRLNPTLLAARIPLVLVNAAQPFIPIVFLRLILNEITMDQDMRRILWYVLSMAAATLAAELISGCTGSLVCHTDGNHAAQDEKSAGRGHYGNAVCTCGGAARP